MSPNSLEVTIENSLQQKVATREAKVGVIGMGYVGLPLALLFSGQGFPITGFDVDDAKVKTLMNGGSYIVRVEAAEIEGARQRGFTATADYAGIASQDVVIICCLLYTSPSPRDGLLS